MPTGLDNLKHIVVLMMNGRSFDHMLGGLSLVRGFGHREACCQKAVIRRGRRIRRNVKKHCAPLLLLKLDGAGLLRPDFSF